MEFYKIFLFLLINLINLDLNWAQESGDDELSYPTVGADNATYSKFPFGLIFGGSKVNAEENVPNRESKEAPVDDEDLDSNKGRAVYWIPTVCDSLAERGYTCLSCGESLHCMGGNFALKAICGGRRPFCSNGVCSDIQGEKCRRDDVHFASAAPHIANAEHGAGAEAINNSTLT